MSELDQLLAMFTRAGIPFQRYDNTARGRIEITVTPQKSEQDIDSLRVGGPLGGVSWASTDYNFDVEGKLLSIWMEGD